MDSLYVIVPALILLLGIVIIWLSIRRSLSLSKKNYPSWRKATERTVLSLVVLLALAVAGYCTYNAIAIQVFLAANPPLGKLYSVNGHKMHLYCLGDGEPTIILEPGLGPATDVLSWSHIQPQLAQTTRVCSYDRAGSGWSEPQSGPRDADHVVSNLHELLERAQIIGPLVLLGTSYGGIFIRDYAAHYPAEVAGLILIDSSTPYQEDRFQALDGSSKGSSPSPAMQLAILHGKYLLGLPRLLGWCGRPVSGWDIRAGKALGEDNCMPHYEGVKEFLSRSQTSAETARAGSFGALPILIFSHDPSKVLAMRNPPAQRVAHEKLWDEMQEDMKSLSTHSRRIIAKGSGHGVCVDREDLILREVPLFLDQIRGAAPQPTNYGSTTVE